jgi:uncharacterized protein (TIGR02599 family)
MHLRAFSLVEVLVSVAVLAILMLIISGVISTVQRTWRSGSSKVSQYREARRAFNRIVSAVSQATMNPYLAYRYSGSQDPMVPPSTNQTMPPSGYMRYSELGFVSGVSAGITGLAANVSPGHALFFQAPLGYSTSYRVPTGLNGCGFYVKFESDSVTRPDFLAATGKVPPSLRYRLYEFRTPVEANSIYNSGTGAAIAPRASLSDWIVPTTIAAYSNPIANNVVLLVIKPKRPVNDQNNAGGVQSPTDIAPNYSYNSAPSDAFSVVEQRDSDFQLPPLVEVTLVAIDEASARNLEIDQPGASPNLASILSAVSLSSAANLKSDLRGLEQALLAEKVGFRIFSATVPIRASKWGKGT